MSSFFIFIDGRRKNKITIDDEAGGCGVAAQLVVGHAGVLAFVFRVDSADGEPGHALVGVHLRRKVFAQPQELRNNNQHIAPGIQFFPFFQSSLLNGIFIIYLAASLPVDLKCTGRFRLAVEATFEGDRVAVTAAQVSQRLDDLRRR